MRKLVFFTGIVGVLTGVSVVMADWEAREPGYTNCLNNAANEISWMNQSIANAQVEIDRIKNRISQNNGDLPRIQSFQSAAEIELTRTRTELQKAKAALEQSLINLKQAELSLSANKKLREFMESTFPASIANFKFALLSSGELLNEKISEIEERLKNSNSEEVTKQLQDQISYLKAGSELRSNWASTEEAVRYFDSLLSNQVDPRDQKQFSSTLVSLLLALQKINNDFVKSLNDARSAEANTKQTLDQLTESVSKLKQEVASREQDVRTAGNKAYQYQQQATSIANEITQLQARFNQLNGDIQNYQILKSARETDLAHGCWDRNKVFVRNPPPERGGGRGGRAALLPETRGVQ